MRREERETNGGCRKFKKININRRFIRVVSIYISFLFNYDDKKVRLSRCSGSFGIQRYSILSGYFNELRIPLKIIAYTPAYTVTPPPPLVCLGLQYSFLDTWSLNQDYSFLCTFFNASIKSFKNACSSNKYIYIWFKYKKKILLT